MPGLLLVTRGLQLVASIGVAKVVTTVVDNAVKSSVGISTVAKAANWTGSFVLASMAVEQAKNHIERAVTKVVEEIEDEKKKREEILNKNNLTEK
jgi:hypothetical protein